MYCPKCGTQNASPGKFCVKCGEPLPKPPPSQPPAYRPTLPPQIPTTIQPANPPNPLAQAATTGGLTGMAGGAMIVVGWLLGGGLPIMGIIFAGGGLLGGLAGNEIGAIFTLLALALAAVVAIVPITGFLCAQTGVSLFELRAYSDRRRITQANYHLGRLRSRSTTVLVMVVLMAVFVSLIPFVGGAFLGKGFYLMAGGAVTAFLGALFAQSQIGAAPSQSTSPLSHPPQLTQEEQEALKLLAQGLSNSEIAERLDIADGWAGSLTAGLLKKFGAESKTELVKLAREMRYA